MTIRYFCFLLLLLPALAAAFSPQAGMALILPRPTIITTNTRTTSASRTTCSLKMLPEEAFSSSSSVLVSLGNGTIDWGNPVEAVVGGITLLYFAFSIAAGIKYVWKDGWRPKL
jgi:hypothetical protein